MATRRAPRPEGRITSISPAFTTKNGTLVWPPSIKTSPRVIGRFNPWEAIREICAVLNSGNMSAAFAALKLRGVEAVVAFDIVYANRLTNSSAFSATSRQPASIVNECPRPVILTISVTPLLRFSFL